jgi:hypothetical protein
MGQPADHDPDKAKSEAEAKKDLMGLLKSKDLSPEEHKKILAIATSLGRDAASADAEHLGSRMTKAVFILVTLIGLALVVLAWFLLGRMAEKLERTGPRASSAPRAERDGSAGGGRGPGRP